MKKIFGILLVVMTVMNVQAVRRYSCDFETQTQRDRWVLNNAANQSVSNSLLNKWYIGEPGNNSRTGQHGLYISDDNGTSAHYKNSGCWVPAYDIITLDNISADYTLSFDYRVMANVACNFDGLYVLWVPMTDEEGDSTKVISIPTSSGAVPARYADYVIRLRPNENIDYLAGTATWRQCAVKIPASRVDGTPHYLAFVWANGSQPAQQPGAVVDNILITDGTPCPQPTNLVVTPNGVSVSLSWQGTAAEYEVSAYSYETNTWAGPKIVTDTQTSFAALPSGQTDFIVRAKCSEGYYSLKTIVSQLIYYPEQMCVDYLDLSKAVCYVDNSSPQNTLTFNDFRQVSAVDYGPSSINSRHTVHFDRTEYEPRTGGLAKTVPDGELGSVRLGNWDSNDHAERIEYTFEVDTNRYPVLLLKYLPILEAPGHEDYENPRFKLDLLINGMTIGECGQADFNANNVLSGSTLKPEAIAQGWHITKSQVAQTNSDIVWKDWTTVGVNLRNPAYQGKRMTVRLTTHDCVYGVHCGYAYFTLGGSDGKLKGMKCGEINETFEAPDGFKYRWAYAAHEKYRRLDGSLPEQYVRGRDQQYHAGLFDDSLYVVDCMFTEDTTCFFSLYASALATKPISVIEHKVIRNCQEGTCKVQFDGTKSWVQEIDHVIGDTSVAKKRGIEHYEWIIEGLPDPYNWSDEPIHTFDFPLEGGDYTVKLITTYGTCSDTAVYHLHLDPLEPTSETQTFVLCDADRKTGFHWAERTGVLDTLYFDYGLVDSIIFFNENTKCDSIIYLELAEPVRIYEDTVILTTDLPYTHHGKTYPVGTMSLIDTIPFPTTCDTTWVINLEVQKSIYYVTTNVYPENTGTVEVVYTEDHSQATMTAIGNSGYHFSQWNDGNTMNPRTVNVTKNATYTAIFEHDDVYVTYIGMDGKNLGVETVAYGSSAQQTGIDADEFGYTLTGWDKDLTSVTENMTVTASYTRDAINGFYYIFDRENRTAVLDREGNSYAKIKTLNVPNHFIYRGTYFAVVAVGANAFEGCTRLTDVVLPSNVEDVFESAFSGCSDMVHLTMSAGLRSIADYAFNGCKRLEDITVYAERVPDLTATSFNAVGNKKYINVYVPDNRVNNYKRDDYWSEFNIVVKSAEIVEGTVEDVAVQPEETTAQFTWPTESNAGSYTIQITKDGEVFCTLIFNANGQLTGIAFAPGRDDNRAPAATTTANGGMQFTVTGLDAGTTYAYTVTTKDTNERVIATYEGSFETNGTMEDGIEDVQTSVAPKKVVRDGQIYILRGEKVFTLQGVEVK